AERDEEPSVSPLIVDHREGSAVPIIVEPSGIKATNRHINPDLILGARTRSGSISKRNLPSSELSPSEKENPNKIQK
ncbi:Hypothetical protein FKW44_003466, partial [Caligus rogercresseyi]